MALRKEQVLVLLVLLVGLWLFWNGGGEPVRSPVPTPQRLEYTPAPVPSAPLLAEPPAGLARKLWFREPSETQPLPPRELPFPAREPLFLVGLLLDPGPDPSYAELLRLPGAIVEGVNLAPPAETAATGPGGDGDTIPGQGPESRAEKKQRWARIYDQVWLENQSEPLFGLVSATQAGGAKVDPFRLEELDDFGGLLVTLQQFSLEKERILTPPVVFGRDERVRVRKVVLADKLRNEVGRRVRRVPEDGAHHVERLQLIDWLLGKSRDEAWVFEEALRQAGILVRQGAGLEGHRAMARVLRLQGALAQEFELYRGLTGSGPEAAFRHEGLGNLLALMGLHRDAEAELRQAVAATPTDPRPHASLAMFLRQRGRPREAAQVSARAMGMIGSVPAEQDRLRVVATEVACSLGIGAIARARQAVAMLGGGATPGGAYLRGCIDYAAGDAAAAREAFRAAAGSADGARATLGLAACQLRLGEWQEAMQGFESVAEQAPLLRHMARAGQALLHLRLGQFDAAIGFAEEALAADPPYAYALYLKGRAQAEQGLLTPALESFMAALRLRDDFVPALVEVSEVHARLLQDSGAEDQARHALAAMRYADRAVELAATPLVTLFERQALRHYAAGDLRGAAQAFTAARDAARDDEDRRFAQAGLAVIDYSLDRSEDALAQLDRLITDLPREHAIRKWAENTRLLIDDHAQKERLEDRFARQEPGNVWSINRDGPLGAVVENERMVFRGRFSKPTEVSATRSGAVPKGGRFLAVSVRMALGPEHHAKDTFAGLRLQTARGATGAVDFKIELGLRDGRPWLFVQDGREEPTRHDLGIELRSGAQELELRVLPRGADERQFALQASWNGQVVHTQDLKQLRRDSPVELQTVLVVGGRQGAAVDVHFDDYHLERRKDG